MGRDDALWRSHVLEATSEIASRITGAIRSAAPRSDRREL